MAKKKWKKPKLIVLVKACKQESVLVYCKTAIPPGGPGVPGMCDEGYDPYRCYDITTS